MDREQYLRELDARLSNRMPPRELEGIMRYYEEYFDEMGAEREPEAIQNLGSPADLVARILGERTAREPGPQARVVDLEEYGGKPSRRGLSMGWKIVIAICAAPIVIPLALSLIAVAVSLLIGILALFAGLAVGGVACVAFGVFAAAAGFSVILVNGVATTM